MQSLEKHTLAPNRFVTSNSLTVPDFRGYMPSAFDVAPVILRCQSLYSIFKQVLAEDKGAS